VNSRAQQQIRVVRVAADVPKIHLPRLARREKIFLVLLPRAELAAEVQGLNALLSPRNQSLSNPAPGGAAVGLASTATLFVGVPEAALSWQSQSSASREQEHWRPGR